MALKNNTWTLNQWYDQDVAGNVSYSTNIKHLYGWGRNDTGGILADNTIIDRSSPTQIPGSTWKYISCAGDNAYNAMGLKTDGTMWVWGRNLTGDLGQNQADAQLFGVSSPVQIPGTNWSDAFHCSTSQGIATKADGTLWIWGSGNDGMIGQNQPNNADYSSPVQIPGTNWGTTRGKVGRSTAVKTDGTLWIWGKNGSGILGQNQAEAQLSKVSSPVQIPGTTWARTWNSGEGTYFGVKSDNTLWSWGFNQ